MKSRRSRGQDRVVLSGLVLLVAGLVAHRAAAFPQATVSLAPGKFARVGTVDERYQSYNVEMLEVTGGHFWRPYTSPASAPAVTKGTPAPSTGPSSPPPNMPTGLSPDLYEYRPPIDLADARLRTLAAGLGPAYMRVSGTWANSTYFADTDPPPTAPPAGFKGVLTRAQWKGVVDFSRAADGRIVTSFAISAGTRDASGTWTPEQARRLVEYTRAAGGSLSAAEFMNEPNAAAMGGAPAGYDAAAYARDFAVFRAYVRASVPDLTILGPGSVGETMEGAGGGSRSLLGLRTRDLLAASERALDAFSYHHYGTVSKRCAGLGIPLTTPEDALSEQWLARTDVTLAFYKALRDEFAPGKPLWLTETADAACGGNPWAPTFLDTFRYLDQLGRLARQGVQVVAHNTLAASDYALLDGHTFLPRPSYWGAFLWRKLMGTTVLDPGIPQRPGLHTYAHCLRGKPGGVAVLVLNTDPASAQTLQLPAGERYALRSADLQSGHVQLNGKDLGWDGRGELPRLAPEPSPAGDVAFAPASITFVSFPEAANPVCR